MPGRIERPALLYWGRRGPITTLARTLAEAARAQDITCFLSLSQQNLAAGDFSDLGDRLLPVRTFDSMAGAIAGLARMPTGQRDFVRTLRDRGVDAVINLMPHVWSPFAAPRIKALGIPYATIIHDAAPHPGDPTGLVNRWLLQDARHADVVFTLSATTAEQLGAKPGWEARRIVPLFHPDLVYDAGEDVLAADAAPLRVLFFGRILAYKGLDVFAEALSLLAARGRSVAASVIGEGPISLPTRQVLARLGVRIDNRWVADAEISQIFQAHDIVAATHVEASQSGVVATALAHGRPVVVTPVGGLVEQVKDGRTGLVAAAVTASAVADAIDRLAGDAELRRAMASTIRGDTAQRSGHRFLRQMLDALAVRTD